LFLRRTCWTRPWYSPWYSTLRQRLRRVGEISGLDFETADWLTVEITVKLVRLRKALEASSV